MKTMTESIHKDRSNSISASPMALMMACLCGLIFLNFVQLLAGLSTAEIRPPVNVLPLIAATAALGIAAAVLVGFRQRMGSILGVIFCLVSMIGAGPHKLFLENGLQIAPMALLGFAAEVVFIYLAWKQLTAR